MNEIKLKGVLKGPGAGLTADEARPASGDSGTRSGRWKSGSRQRRSCKEGKRGEGLGPGARRARRAVAGGLTCCVWMWLCSSAGPPTGGRLRFPDRGFGLRHVTSGGR